jgi:ATP-dependent DNA helicase RecG
MGTQQSGILDLLIADISKDSKILELAREAAKRLLEDDPELLKEDNSRVQRQVSSVKNDVVNWSRIS